MNADFIQVLLVEDNPGDARLVAEMLREEAAAGFALTHVSTVADAIARLGAERSDFDAVLLDLSLPDESGLETVRRVIQASHHAVVVVMTGAGDEEMGLAATREGAQDYLVKGQVDGQRLRRAIRYAIERQDKRLELQSLSLKDDLTGLHNRRGFLTLAEQQMKLARRNRTHLHVLFIDLDQLKQINDTFGHAEGNRAITETADVLRDCFRQSDILARLGGDEFAALAVNSMADEAALRSRIRAALDQVNVKPDRAYPLELSIGILACTPADDLPIEVLLEQADALMYAEKRRKRPVRAS